MKTRMWMIVVLAALLVTGIALSVVEAVRTHDWWAALLNLGPELIGAVVTYALFEVFIGSRAKTEEDKARLIREMGSTVADVAVAAVDKLRQRFWLYDGSLRKAYLPDANLQGALLYSARLQEAYLAGANLEKAILYDAKLQGAGLDGARLQGAGLFNADLQGARLMRAKLQGTDLSGANLQGAEVEGARYSKHTVLPDGTEWTRDTDMARFTDPEHPDFWRSDNPYSPAYRGGLEVSREVLDL